ncbi:hypothetical protein AAMO2058_001644900 [Amorphochlora amoebiformis]
MADSSAKTLRKKLEKVLSGEDLNQLTRRQARTMLEEELGLEKNALKKRKNEINQFLAEIVEKRQEDEKKDDDDDDDEDDEVVEPPRKKKKTSKKETGEASDVKAHTCTTRSGNSVPKKLKEKQSELMSKKYFLDYAKEIAIDIHGNKLTGKARDFSSGNLGWYLGGKIEIPVGKKNVWCQVGINVTIPGSKEWD